MKPSRTTQPYRKGAREPGAALTAMLRGRTSAGYNPKDLERHVQTLTRAGGRGRTARQPRKPRQPR